MCSEASKRWISRRREDHWKDTEDTVININLNYHLRMGEDNLHLPNNASKQDLQSFFQTDVVGCPTDNHSPWPISAIQGGHCKQHGNISLNPMDIDSPWPISAIQGGHSMQHCNTSIYPMGIDAPWPTSTIQGGHSQQHLYMSIHPTGIDAPWPISIFQGGHSQQHWHTSLYPMGIHVPWPISTHLHGRSWQHLCMYHCSRFAIIAQGVSPVVA